MSADDKTLWDIHPNSRKAWREFDQASRAFAVCELLHRRGHPMTDRQVCNALGSQDMNYARPTITHLVQAGVLVEVDSVEDPATHRTVRRVYFKP